MKTTEPYLLTPGPLTTAKSTKEAMLRDWGSRDTAFIELNRRFRQRLLAISGAAGSHVCVPMQGSGTFIVEATLGTLIPRDGKALVLVNGAYGHRMVRMLEIMGRSHSVVETAEDVPSDPAAVTAALDQDSAITHVLVVHCETTSGILNPIEAIADVVASHRRHLIIDAMSAFGAIPFDGTTVPFDALMASSNKCLEGVPGMGFAIVSREAIADSSGNAHSLSLDLYDQWTSMEKNGQWRFTPPTHVIAAFDHALDRFEAEGGVDGRHARYAENCRILIDGMAEMGFVPLLPASLQAPIIVTFRMPGDSEFDFQAFYDALQRRGYVIYPGKLTVADSFRIGCIGDLDAGVMQGALIAIRETLDEMGVGEGTPAAA